MSKRSVLLLSLVPAFLLGGVFAVAQAQTAGSPAASRRTGLIRPPGPTARCRSQATRSPLRRDKEVILDVSPPALGGLSIDGKLTFSNNADLELTTEWIMLHGELAIGSEASPHTRNATITLTNTVKGEDVMAGMGDRGIMISGGTLNLHGDRTNTWTKLASTAKAGSDFDRGPERRGLARRRRDRPRVDGFRSPAGRAAHHFRHPRQQDHARQEARLHALRQDHLRRG